LVTEQELDTATVDAVPRLTHLMAALCAYINGSKGHVRARRQNIFREEGLSNAKKMGKGILLYYFTFAVNAFYY
jgi:hypothetical protein